MKADLVYALDPVRFARRVLGFDVDAHQSRVLRSRARNSLLVCTRQFGKSTTAAAAAVHEALYGRDPVVVIVSPAGRQSKELGLKVEQFLSRCDDRAHVLRRDDELGLQLANGARIVLLPGVEATTRGVSGCTLLLVDEAARLRDAVYRSLRPMLATTNGRTWLMSTPYGKRGFFWEATQHAGWEISRVTARECPRILPAFLDQEFRELGERWFAQEYLCEFLNVTEGVFHHDLVMQSLDAGLEPLPL